MCDLDNTLWDWVTYFALAFEAMLRQLVPLVGVDEARLCDEFRLVHQRYRNSEQPFAVLELPSVREKFGTVDRAVLKRHLDPALRAFNRARREHLHLYPGVETTLANLSSRGVRLVGHTEAMLLNSYFRLKFFGIDGYFARLYCPVGLADGHPLPEREALYQPPLDFAILLPPEARKPSRVVLDEIRQREGAEAQQTWYVGDSKARDIRMAVDAGVRSVWARYGTAYDPHHWRCLVRVTHWTPEDVLREEVLRDEAARVNPEFVIDSFSEVQQLLHVV